MKYLGIDYGTRRTGVAVCDARGKVASPLTVIERQKELIPRLRQIIHQEEIEAVVVGLPLNMDGTVGPAAERARKFAAELQRSFGIPVYLEDERLSSFAAAEKLAPAGYSRARKRKRLDAVAAADILQAFLDRHDKTSTQQTDRC